jgi:hypothetical protein
MRLVHTEAVDFGSTSARALAVHQVQGGFLGDRRFGGVPGRRVAAKNLAVATLRASKSIRGVGVRLVQLALCGC